MWAVCCQTLVQKLRRILVGRQSPNDWGLPKFSTPLSSSPHTRGCGWQKLGGKEEKKEGRQQLLCLIVKKIWKKELRIRNSLWHGIFWAGWAGWGIMGLTDRRIFDSWWTDEFRHGSVSRKRQGQMETHSLSLILIFFFSRRSEFPNSLKCFNASWGIIFQMPFSTYS